jgi:GH25 family lysozyme M1 (1,4-beta-N-acetylmuramidase)
VLYYEELSGYRWIAGFNHSEYEPEVRDKGALMWQYTSSGSVDGISGSVDMDRLMQGISF